jgi:CubicO group peptidase (beta-lactamase class C family)
LEQIVQSYVDAKQFMGSVLVAENGNILLNKGYGSANLEWNIPNAPSTRFRIASLTKQFTAAAILLLEERGKLKTDDPVKEYVPGAPAAWDKITIFHLLTNTSGIPDFTSFTDFGLTQALPTSPEQLIARFRNKPLNFQPGEQWEYSSSGYILLGYLIEKISGQSYKDFLQEKIFKPLSMQQSGYDMNSLIIPRRASGYALAPNGFVNAPYIDMSIPYSAGGLYSTTEDLLRWEQALFGGRVLSAAALKKMTTPFKHEYACGLEVRSLNGRTIMEHGGAIEGFSTRMAYYPSDKLTVVVLANSSAGASDLAANLASAVHGERVVLPSTRKEVTVSPKVLSQYVGAYELTPKLTFVITLVAGRLIVEPTNQPSFPLFAESETKFFSKVADAEAEFTKGDIGQVVLTWRQGGREWKASRK